MRDEGAALGNYVHCEVKVTEQGQEIAFGAIVALCEGGSH